MSSGDARSPWWFSGDDAPQDGPPADDSPQDAPPPSMDWTALVAGAVRMVDWAAERVLAPHADHADPNEHPDCMVCRTVALVGNPVGLMSGSSGEERSPEDHAGDGPGSSADSRLIRWIPIVESGD